MESVHSEADISNQKSGKAYIPVLLGLLCWIPVRLIVVNEETFAEQLFKYMPGIFFFLTGFLFLRKQQKLKEIIMLMISAAVITLYNSILPFKIDSQSVILAIIHGYCFLWLLICLLFSDGSFKNIGKTKQYVEIWGEMLCWSSLLLLAGGLMTVLSMLFFETLKIDAFKIYFENVVTLGVVMAPFLSYYLSEKFSQIKISAVISQIFSPIAVVMVSVFLITSLLSIEKVYNDRNVFIIYNAVLLLVIAIVFFSSNRQSASSKFLQISNMALAFISTILNMVVLSASLYRITQFGLTPNKFVVVGLNILLLANLVFICVHYVKSMLRRDEKVEINAINRFLPLYFAWSIIVTVLVPLIFKMA